MDQESHREVADSGAELVLLYIPMQEEVDERALLRELNLHGVGATDVDRDLPFNFINDIGDRVGVPVIDSRCLLKTHVELGRRNFWLEDRHFRELGKKAVAETILDWLSKHSTFQISIVDDWSETCGSNTDVHQ